MTATHEPRLVRLDDVPDIPYATEPPPPADEHTSSWQHDSLIKLAANPPEPPCIGGLLYPGKRTVLSGETESMKTWLALILCKAELDIGIPVAWVDLDAMGPGAMLERLQLLGVQEDVIDRDFLYYEPSDQLDLTNLTAVTDTLTDRGVRLFVIDAFNPILSLHDLEPNSTPDIETFWRVYADPICRAGAAPVLLDHVVKNSESRGKYSYGSERKASGAIVHIGFRLLEPLTKGGRGRSLLTVHKDRPGYLPRPTLGRLILTSDNTSIDFQLEPDKSHDADGGFRPTVLMEKISRYLEQQTEPVSGNTIETEVTGNGEAKRTALKTLVEDAYAASKTGARRAVLYTTVRPYREAGDNPNPTSSPVRPDFVLDLRSRPTSSSSPPLTGTRSVDDPQGRPRPTSSSSTEEIPEYNHDPTEPEHPDSEEPADRWWDR